MSHPVYLHLMQDGSIWAGNDRNDTPKTGTVAAIFSFNSDLSFQKVGQVTGTTGNYNATGANGKNGKEYV